ncbi:hypothetical protein ASG67_17645 [Sphingomonas sp. Leaf339]|uniref:hypothetical protein n=1 Tax=Sphingomonas sp. Leaf339 TaxID=1736343 RepID=UPI0006F8AE07|nr:hypothetical protein [Sphingomonas sp. Leaf339]KQU56599.1 hypothetical protein ASG67_17645 [Sphingomonas sp. Leaf339]
MLRWTALPEFYGLLELMLDAEQRGPHFILNGAQCGVSQIDERQALLEAAGQNFAFAAFFPGWHGDYSTTPVHILTVGEHHTFMVWLPIARCDKLRIISCLRVSAMDKVLCRLSI